MKPRPHYLTTFRRRMDQSGQVYYSAILGNSRLLLFPGDDGELHFYLGQQIMENKSREDGPGGANSKRPVSLDGMR